ncbi:MAG: TRAP transporter small permease [Blautia sp.]|nr:TRAP transporter small permease [Blautia sp.]
MKALEKISNSLDKVCEVLIVLMIGAMVIITTAQIIFRTWFTALTWSDEVTRYLLIWSTFLGATCVYRHGGNIAITFIQEAFPEKVTRFLRIFVHLLCMLLFIVLFYYGCRYVTKLNKTATTLPIKMKYIFLCIPISMVICAFHALVLMLKEMKGKDGKEGET